MQPIRRTARHSIPGVLALAGLAFGGGCGDPVVDPPVPATITITPTIDFLLEDAGRTVQLTAIVRDRDRHVITTVEVAWSSSDSNIVEVSETGLVTGGEPGKATVQASVGPLASAANITVAPGPRAVLYKFYREMGGDDWVNNRDWRKDTPYHMWYGVKIDTLGSITGLWLPYNELAGPIPPELGMLRGMRDLWLSWNRVTGPMPPELGNLRELEWLRLEHNELTGSIPPELGNLRNLLSIQLYDNELTGSIPPELGNLQNLWGLMLSGNVLTGPIPSELGGLKDLGILDLSDNKLTGPVPREFGALQALSYLDLSDNQLGGPLPRELVRLRLGHFFWDNTNLCAPTDDAFQQWLASITHHKGNRNCDS